MAASLALLVAVGCGGAPPPAQPEWTKPVATDGAQPPFAAPGERVRYRVSAYNVELASMQLAVGDVTELEGKKAIVIQATAQSEGLAARVKPVTLELTSWLDVANGQPLLFRAVETAGKDDATVEQVDARFTQLANKLLPIAVSHPSTPTEPEKLEQQVITNEPHELLGTLFLLRTWDDKPGTTRTFDTVRSKFMWRLQATIIGREVIPTELGELPALKIEAVNRRLMRDGSLDKGTEARTFTVWISDDADRVPLRMVAESDYGNVTLDIADYTAGNPL